jgi:hypothetical protein
MVITLLMAVAVVVQRCIEVMGSHQPVAISKRA